MTTTLEESLPQRNEADNRLLESESQEQLGMAKIQDDGAASYRYIGTNVQPTALGLGPEIYPRITHRFGSVSDVAIGSLTISGTEKLFVLVTDIYKGLRHYEISDHRVQQMPIWQYSSREKDSHRTKKDIVVRPVCTLADGRVAMGIWNRRHVLLLRWSPPVAGGDGSTAATKGSWSVERKVKLRCCPYRIGVLGNDLLALTGAEEQEDSLGPGTEVAIAWLSSSSVRLTQCGKLNYKVAALSLADGQLIASSADLYESGKLLSYVVEAYDLPERPDDNTRGVSSSGQKSPTILTHRWTCEFDERVPDVCAVPSKAAVYVALPSSRRVAALDLRTGEMLIDVLDCGSSRPIRIDVTPLRQLPVSGNGKVNEGKRGRDESDLYTLKAAILYDDSSISVHKVGAFD